MRQEPFLTPHRLSPLSLNNSDPNHWALKHTVAQKNPKNKKWEKQKQNTDLKNVVIFLSQKYIFLKKENVIQYKQLLDNRNSLCI